MKIGTMSVQVSCFKVKFKFSSNELYVVTLLNNDFNVIFLDNAPKTKLGFIRGKANVIDTVQGDSLVYQ